MPKPLKVDYKPTPGYFDLTNKPNGMSATLHKKVQDLQMTLVAEARKYENRKLREDNRSTYEKLQEHMAELQQAIIHYWGDSLFEVQP